MRIESRVFLVHFVALVLCAPLAQAFRGGAEKVRPKPYCARLNEIRIIPLKGEPVKDTVYNGLMAEGVKAIPCLLRRITDTRQMRDPRRSYALDSIAVGDLAVFMIWDLGDISEETLLPEAIRPAYKEQGIYAYFAYVEKPRNRRAMKRYLEVWYRAKYGDEGRPG